MLGPGGLCIHFLYVLCRIDPFIFKKKWGSSGGGGVGLIPTLPCRTATGVDEDDVFHYYGGSTLLNNTFETDQKIGLDIVSGTVTSFTPEF